MRRGLVAIAAITAALVLGATAAAPALAKMKTVVKTLCTDTSLAIPDGGASGDYVSGSVSTGSRCPRGYKCGYGGLPVGSRVIDVDARLRVTHPAPAHLTAVLVSPVGALVTVASGRAAALGSGATDCGAGFATFDDEAADPFRPLQPLSGFDGSFGAGDWRFYFDDVAAGGAGSVDAIGIRLTYRHKAKKPKRKRAARRR